MGKGWGGKRAGAGRPPGSKNRRTLAVEQTLERLGCDPIEGLALIANNDKERLGLEQDIPIALRAKCFSELAPYIAPRMKASEITYGDQPEHQRVVLHVDPKLAQVLADRRGEPLKDLCEVLGVDEGD